MADSIFKQLIESLPADPNGVLTTVVVAMGIGIGALTALLGALHSRVTISLMMLSLGAVLGVWVPSSLGMEIDRAITISIGSVVFGLLGYLLHRVCVAVGLGVLATIASMAILYEHTRPIDTAASGAVDLGTSFLAVARSLWETAPENFRSLAPWVALATFLVATILGLIFRKFGMAALYSLGGTMLTLFCIRLGHASDKITWLDSLKSGPMTIAALGMAMLLVGFMTQMVLLHRPTTEPEPSRRKEEEVEV